MDKVQSEAHARLFLEGIGFTVESIPLRKNRKRIPSADFRVTYGSEKYIIEAKQKYTQAYKKMLEQARADGLASIAREPLSWTFLAKQFEHANKQLKTTRKAEDSFCIFFVSCLSEDFHFVSRTISRYLYGSVKLGIFAANTSDHFGVKECLYWNSNGFSNLPDMDAVVVGRPDGQRLYLNPFTSNIVSFRESKLYAFFLQCGAITDAELMERERQCIALRVSDAAATPEIKRKFILEHYGYRITEVRENHFQAVLVC